MNPNQKRSLVLASIIGTLFACYDQDERTRLHEELHSRVSKGIRKQSKLFGSDVVTQVIHKTGEKIWRETVDHFTERKITIEASYTILSIVNMDEKALSKHYGLSAGKLGKWAKPTLRDDRLALEQTSKEVADHLYQKISKHYGIEVVQSESVLEKIAKARMSA